MNPKNLWTVLAIACFFCLIGCEGSRNSGGGADGFIEYETAEEKKFLLAAEPFYVAIVKCEFEQAYDMLSEWAVKDVHPIQFMPEEPDENAARIDRLSREQFVESMKSLQSRAGKFRNVSEMYVNSTDANILSGVAKEEFDNLDIMMAIGAMSKSVPADIRRAAIRGTIDCNFREEDVKQIMAEVEVTSEDALYEQFEGPYFTLKTVLVEVDGQLKVGYFEFVPPSIMD